jgi:beta-glucosidase
MAINDTKPELNKHLFGENFYWGVSTASFQTEGAWQEDGKGESIWDNFTHKKGKIHQGQTADVTCDFYHRYEQDIDLIKQLNIPNFRFSIAWSRILPLGTGQVNQAGIDFYNRVIDYCLLQGIQPWVTLYHWDLPQALELQGGWTNRDVVQWFTDYVTICAKSFGDRVKHWMVMNEPTAFTGVGHFFGLHAPGRKGLGNFLPACHHTALSIGAGARALRNLLPNVEIGSTYSCSHVEPFSGETKDVAAALRIDALMNRMFIEPVLGLGYPTNDLPVLRKIEKYMKADDEKNMGFDLDFIGLQNYTRDIVKYSFFVPYVSAKMVEAKDRNVPLTDMGWEIYPDAMYQVIKKFTAYPQIKKIYITENGAAFPDVITDGQIRDNQRTQYIKDNLLSVLKAKQEGCPVNGYFVWTLTDNFEWAEGYRPRFGLIHVDFETQERLVKASGNWYKEFLEQ